MTKYVLSAASIDPTEQYRYWLCRQWVETPLDGSLRTIGWIGYNPSTADGLKDDHTIRKEVEFSRRWGYHRMLKGNLHAYRSTDWRKLYGVADPIGPDNPAWLTRIAEQAEIVVCAWGAIPYPHEHAKALATWAMGLPHARCLGKTQGGQPRHPLMLSYGTPLEAWV